MKIAHVLPSSVKFPLDVHNGRYDWVLTLARLQVKMGHDVSIYCNADSVVEGIKCIGIKPSSNDKKQNNLATFMLAFSNDHDIYHSHFDNLHYEVASETTKPIIYTQHWWPTPETIKIANEIHATNVWAVPPTKYMYDIDLAEGIQSKGYILHGIDTSTFKNTNTVKNDRLLFVGRIAPEKNLPIAIAVAKKAGKGLDIIGKVAEKNEQYWQGVMKEIDGVQIKYHGPKSHEHLAQYYSNALALMFPSDTSEPFGLVAIEAQLYGTPVLMYEGGSRGELIEEGKTGFLCKNEDEFVSAIEKLNTLLPENCITYAKKFDVVRMAKEYELLYKSLISS